MLSSFRISAHFAWLVLSKWVVSHFNRHIMVSILLFYSQTESLVQVLYLSFMAKPAFRRIWAIFFPFSKNSVVFPDAMISSAFCSCFGISLFAVWITPWQIVELIPGGFSPLEQVIPGILDIPPSESKLSCTLLSEGLIKTH